MPKGRKKSSSSKELQKLKKSQKSLIKKLEKINAMRNKEKSKILELNKIVRDTSFNKVLCNKNLRAPVKRFIESQLETCKHKPKGRRYTLEDKILALSIMKHSPKGCRFLQSIFNLPSRSQLTQLLQKIEVEPGFNEMLFNELQPAVKNLKPKHRACTLIFDEVSLSAGLEYEPMGDQIIGFENFGKGSFSEERNTKFADHAIVFMLRGVTKNWKQPVMYFHVSSTCPAAQIANAISTIVKTAHKTGLKIVSTVCDGGATNAAKIKLLRQKKQIEYARLGEMLRHNGLKWMEKQ